MRGDSQLIGSPPRLTACPSPSSHRGKLRTGQVATAFRLIAPLPLGYAGPSMCEHNCGSRPKLPPMSPPPLLQEMALVAFASAVQRVAGD